MQTLHLIVIQTWALHKLYSTRGTITSTHLTANTTEIWAGHQGWQTQAVWNRPPWISEWGLQEKGRQKATSQHPGASFPYAIDTEKKTKSKQKEMPREEPEFRAEHKSQKVMGNEERLCIPPVENIRAWTQSGVPLLDKQQPFLFF